MSFPNRNNNNNNHGQDPWGSMNDFGKGNKNNNNNHNANDAKGKGQGKGKNSAEYFYWLGMQQGLAEGKGIGKTNPNVYNSGSGQSADFYSGTTGGKSKSFSGGKSGGKSKSSSYGKASGRGGSPQAEPFSPGAGHRQLNQGSLPANQFGMPDAGGGVAMNLPQALMNQGWDFNNTDGSYRYPTNRPHDHYKGGRPMGGSFGHKGGGISAALPLYSSSSSSDNTASKGSGGKNNNFAGKSSYDVDRNYSSGSSGTEHKGKGFPRHNRSATDKHFSSSSGSEKKKRKAHAKAQLDKHHTNPQKISPWGNLHLKSFGSREGCQRLRDMLTSVDGIVDSYVCVRLQNVNPMSIFGPEFANIAASYGVAMHKGFFCMVRSRLFPNACAFFAIIGQRAKSNRAPKVMVMSFQALQGKLGPECMHNLVVRADQLDLTTELPTRANSLPLVENYRDLKNVNHVPPASQFVENARTVVVPESGTQTNSDPMFSGSGIPATGDIVSSPTTKLPPGLVSPKKATRRSPAHTMHGFGNINVTQKSNFQYNPSGEKGAKNNDLPYNATATPTKFFSENDAFPNADHVYSLNPLAPNYALGSTSNVFPGKGSAVGAGKGTSQRPSPYHSNSNSGALSFSFPSSGRPGIAPNGDAYGAGGSPQTREKIIARARLTALSQQQEMQARALQQQQGLELQQRKPSSSSSTGSDWPEAGDLPISSLANAFVGTSVFTRVPQGHQNYYMVPIDQPVHPAVSERIPPSGHVRNVLESEQAEVDQIVQQIASSPLSSIINSRNDSKSGGSKSGSGASSRCGRQNSTHHDLIRSASLSSVASH